jgi:hypothetical protein
MLIPLCSFDRIDAAHANVLLVKWGHKMGPLNRPFPGSQFALFHNGQPVCVVTHGCIISTTVAAVPGASRENSVELSRLCAVRPGLCRVGLRLWREFVFPSLGYERAVSYQDADLHNGNTYRFDGWHRAGYSRSGTDARSGRKGRNKWVWIYPPPKPAL